MLQSADTEQYKTKRQLKLVLDERKERYVIIIYTPNMSIWIRVDTELLYSIHVKFERRDRYSCHEQLL